MLGRCAMIAAVSVTLGCDGAPSVQQEPIGTWVVSSWRATDVSMDARAFAMNVDGDPEGTIDNAADVVIPTLAHDGITSAPPPYDRIAAGETITLLELRAAGGDAALWTVPGTAPDPAPCAGPDDETCGHHLDGTASFAMAGEATMLAGELDDGATRVGPGEAEIVLPLADGLEPLHLPVIAARVAIDDVSGDTLRGVLGGAVTAEYADSTLVPALVEALNVAIAADCPATEPPCCTPGSSGETMIALFDEDDDCRLSRDELSAHTTIDNLLAPDLDLFDADGNFAPNVDGVRDSVSLGAHFEAVPATIRRP